MTQEISCESAEKESYTLSILIPVFNEEDGLEELHKRFSYASEDLSCAAGPDRADRDPDDRLRAWSQISKVPDQ